MVDEIKIATTQVYHTTLVTLGASLIALGLAVDALSPILAVDGFWTAIGGIIIIVGSSYLAVRRIKKSTITKEKSQNH